jgi:hypothetical protein
MDPASKVEAKMVRAVFLIVVSGIGSFVRRRHSNNFVDRWPVAEITTRRADYYLSQLHEVTSNFFDQALHWPK